jgi:hypothetical protein
VKERRPAFRLSRPPSLRKEQEAWPPSTPATPDPSWNLSPRARDHYARIGVPKSATRSGSFDVASEKGLLPGSASFMSHAHTASFGSTISSNEFASPRIGLSPAVSPAPSVYLPLVRPIQVLASRGINSAAVPASSRASSIYSAYTAPDSTPYDDISNASPFAFRLSSALPSAPPQLDTLIPRTESPRLPPFISHPRPVTHHARTYPDHSPVGSMVGLPARPSTSGRSQEHASMSIGSVQAGRAQTNGPGRSFHSISPSLYPKPVYDSSMPMPPPPRSLTPGGMSQRSVRFVK